MLETFCKFVGHSAFEGGHNSCHFSGHLHFEYLEYEATA